eukprot:663547-Pelagomonas_calceolata.AAC.1
MQAAGDHEACSTASASRRASYTWLGSTSLPCVVARRELGPIGKCFPRQRRLMATCRGTHPWQGIIACSSHFCRASNDRMQRPLL